MVGLKVFIFGLIGYTVVESLPSPVPAIHPEDSRTYSTQLPPCGRLGKYRGSSANRLRSRMQEMVRIIGGRPAPPGKWTWQVAVLDRYKVYTIILSALLNIF